MMLDYVDGAEILNTLYLRCIKMLRTVVDIHKLQWRSQKEHSGKDSDSYRLSSVVPEE